MKRCSFLVVGAGKTGMRIARNLERMGQFVTIVEQSKVGGSFIHSFEKPLEIAQSIARNFQDSLSIFKKYPITFEILDSYRHNVPELIKSKIEELSAKTSENLRSFSKIDIIEGKAHFTSQSLIEITNEDNTELVSFDKCILTIGKQSFEEREYPFKEDISGFILSENEIFTVPVIPQHLLILGCEQTSLNCAELYADLGVKVTVVDSRKPEECLENHDKTSFNTVIKELMRKHVTFRFSTEIKKIKKQDDKTVLVKIKDGDIEVSHIYTPTRKVFLDTVSASRHNLKFNENGFVTDTFGKVSGSNSVYAFGEAVAGNNISTNFIMINNFLSFVQNGGNQPGLMMGLLSKPTKEAYDYAVLKTPIYISGNHTSSTIGISEDNAVSLYGPQVKKTIVTLTNGDRIKCLYRESNGLLIGVSLTGSLTESLFLFIHFCIEKKLTIWEFKQLMNSYQYLLESRGYPTS